MTEREDPLRVRLKNVRLSYPHIFKPKAFGDGKEGEPKYSASFLMDPGTKIGKINIERVEDAIEAAKKAQWPKVAPKLSPAKICLREGDDLEEPQEAYEGMVYVSASELRRPRVLDLDGEDVRDGEEGAPYGGCYVDAIVRVWAQDNKYGKRINAGLIAVKFRDDGDAFGAAPFDPSEFDDDDDKPRSRSRSKDDDDEKPRSRSSSRSRDDDDDDKPRSRSRSRDDDDDPPARSSRSRSSKDDDDDDKPRSRSRSRDDDDPPARSSRSRDDDDKPSSRSSRSRDDDDDKPPARSSRSRSRDDDDDPPRSSRSRSRDDDDDKPRSRNRSRRDDDDVT